MWNIFDIDHIFIVLKGYKLSYAEFLGTLFGLLSVWFAAKQHMLTWYTGIINILFFVALFYQVQLYSDMFLQFYYLGMTIYGWYTWRNEMREDQPIHVLSHKQRIMSSVSIITLSAAMGLLMKNIHWMLPSLFTEPAAYPWLDSAIAVMSIFAMTMMAKRQLESWILWILVNILCIYVYTMKHILFTAWEYAIFLCLAFVGLRNWYRLSLEKEK
ncbi:MAG: nicotinamide mononucleotide transporter [Chitinophagaceae bacterium]|nr:nicotinamide mononucleotide transporter [Chitinophagaceae bacterium]